ncbi:E3 ubiquitin-protein ligase PRT1 isoform X2 [Lactuca sativa]|uniref:RING-type domain-containing protein n=1 Tax=Lactuca sativa TaxID=4236 RepID=A0A9R1XWY6_LACSA|nr:E3 ubiquitin-protein ligase PRT1 isoform X2 [Lactuca sativa]KAJ0225799.1 hypothetical protein LSAT_V11C100028620 [Lactuca sativa]
MNTLDNDPAIGGGGFDGEKAGDDKLEEFSDDFKCCVCLDLIYKPVVLACGHISCFWCVFEAMDTWQESSCPVCRHSYNHFPSICWLLHSVLLKLYPKDYQIRETQVKEDEKTRGTFSPQFENYLTVSNNNKQGEDCSVEESLEPDKCTKGTPTTSSDEISKNVAVNDLLCGICKELLYRPVVLNCGHVFCETCIVDSSNKPCRCPVCQSMHPNGFPKVCLVLEGFLEQNLPEEYSARKAAINNLKQGGSSTGSTQVPQGGQCSSVSMSDYLCKPGLKVHFGVGCDFCGMYPLVGDRYKCEDCLEDIGFDLCEDCYKNSSNLSGRFNQQHKPDHKFKVVEPNPIIILSSEFPEDHTHDDQDNQTDRDSSDESHQDPESDVAAHGPTL